MKIVLIIFLLINGQWIDGNTLDGWSEREQPSLEVCVERAELINSSDLRFRAKCEWRKI